MSVSFILEARAPGGRVGSRSKGWRWLGFRGGGMDQGQRWVGLGICKVDLTPPPGFRVLQ